MLEVLDFDKFTEKKNRPGVICYIFLLEKEYSVFEEETYWMNSVQESISLVRLKQDEFAALDIGVHPKTIIFKNGRESFTQNGVLDFMHFQKVYQKVVNSQPIASRR